MSKREVHKSETEHKDGLATESVNANLSQECWGIKKTILAPAGAGAVAGAAMGFVVDGVGALPGMVIGLVAGAAGGVERSLECKAEKRK
jgi:hypothetical protein